MPEQSQPHSRADLIDNARGLAGLGLDKGYDELLYALSDELERLEEQYQAAREEITRQHATLWLLGLDDHEGEQPTTLDVAIDNLRELWRQKSNPASRAEA